MGAEGFRKKTADGRTPKPLGLKIKKKNKNKSKNKEHHENIDYSELVQNGENLYKAKEEKKNNKSAGQKRRSMEEGSKSRGVKLDQFADEASKPDNGKLEKEQRKLMRMKKIDNDKRDEAEVAGIRNEAEDTYDEKYGADTSGEKRRRKLRKKKIKNEKFNKVGIAKGDELYNEVEDGSNAHDGRKLRKKKIKNEKLNKVEMANVDELYNEVEDGSNSHDDDRKMGASQSEDQGWIESAEPPKVADSVTKTRKSKKAHKIKRKDRLASEGVDFALEKGGQAEEGVYQISSGDEDCSRGMKKWIMEHYQSRPGLKVLQQRIDDFITAHDAQEEQARKEREAQAADGGWTVVVHHKGRKKTTDSESGITVGSVAPAAVMDKMVKKKSKEVGLDFYRFQRREAQRNEIMILQSKFEQDKKRIQQLRAARKFRPY